ncbi:tetratricopeptide repeat protein [Duganella sp. FT3S]|uniref:Tetratricopeptide repeat protein n=1 Tax=Rugamonas fusca TaxID=2758568 RepID=A0A7W2I7R6_9BURK|nr:tetratricopeptide repeat protein [Rugamonas fusca]MBA5606724.1 tetratricopeptide repeat protein [Rugamonas fusca]
MSLLMQALKKAERAKQNSIPETELEKPSEAFDELLALTPQETAPPARAGGEFMLDLEPLDGPPVTATPAAPAPVPMPPAALDAALAPLSFETEPPIPVLAVADEAIHDPVPPQARQQEPGRPVPPPAAQAAAQAAQASQNGAGDGRAKPDAPRGAARARAAAAASMASGGAGMDPAKIRLAVLSGVAVLIAAVFGYIYWQALTGPGPGARLPMVPMPPPNATTGAASAQLVVAAPGAATNGPPTGGAQPSAAPLPAAPAGVPLPTGATPAAIAGAPIAPAPAGAASAQYLIPPPSGPVTQEEYARHDQPPPEPAMNNAPALNAPAGAKPGVPGQDALAPLAAPDNSDIKVARSSVPSQTDPNLEAAYQAFNGGDLARAQQQYALALRTDPNNRDALLGTAAVALRQRQGPQAAAIYSRLLDLDPNDGDALAGLIGLRQGDAALAELRLKTMLTRTPDAAPLQFALGNLYARQGRWSEAQPAYFRAWSAAPDNADYAYNLAIGLDRLNQGKLALTYYQKALALAQDAPASFDRAALRLRLHQLNQLYHPAQQ